MPWAASSHGAGAAQSDDVALTRGHHAVMPCVMLLLLAPLLASGALICGGAAVVNGRGPLRAVSPSCLESDETLVPIDQAALAKEAAEDDYSKASAEELAEYLPDWAAEMMNDPDEMEDYELNLTKERAAKLHARRVEGRSWEELYSFEGEGAGESFGEEAGMAEFTPEELAEDYSLPLETICAQLLNLGLPSKRLDTRLPVKDMCTIQQISELLAFVSSTDPIAAREVLCDLTITELADELPIGPKALLTLCRKEEITTLLGAETRILQDDYASLMDAVKREVAFLGERVKEYDE